MAKKKNRSVDLEQLRGQIDQLDQKLIDLLVRRRELSSQVVRDKIARQAQIRDFGREERLLRERIEHGSQFGLDRHFVTRVFQEIIDDSVRTQQIYLLKQEQSDNPIKVAYHGVTGSYCELALRQHFVRRPLSEGVTTEFIGYSTFREVVSAVRSGEAHYALVPFENTTRGAIGEVSELILNGEYCIVGEEKLRIDHCILAHPGVKFKEVKELKCSYLAALDCSQFIGNWGVSIEYLADSAMAAADLVGRTDARSEAALASAEAASEYGLEIIKRGIGNHRDNYVRSLLIAKSSEAFDLRIPCKTSMVFATAHHAGALVEGLMVFRDRGINLTKLESHPIPENPWEEMFYLDFEGNLADPNVSEALKELTPCTRFLKVLGSYPAVDIPACSVDTKIGKFSPQALAVVDKGESMLQESQVRASSLEGPSRTIQIGDKKIGDGTFVTFARLDLNESKRFGISLAQLAKSHGVDMLVGEWGSVWDGAESQGRERSNSFEQLREIAKGCGQATIGEVRSIGQLATSEGNLDCIWLRGEQMHDWGLLKLVAKTSLPLVLTRSRSSSFEDLLSCAEKVLEFGNHQVILCEEGVRSFGSVGFSAIDLAGVIRLRERTSLPIIIDPGRACDTPRSLISLVLAARMASVDGVVVDLSLSERIAPLGVGRVALNGKRLEELMNQLLALSV